MEAARFIDMLGCTEGWDVEQADAEQAYVQVICRPEAKEDANRETQVPNVHPSRSMSRLHLPDAMPGCLSCRTAGAEDRRDSRMAQQLAAIYSSFALFPNGHVMINSIAHLSSEQVVRALHG